MFGQTSIQSWKSGPRTECRRNHSQQFLSFLTCAAPGQFFPTDMRKYLHPICSEGSPLDRSGVLICYSYGESGKVFVRYTLVNYGRAEGKSSIQQGRLPRACALSEETGGWLK